MHIRIRWWFCNTCNGISRTGRRVDSTNSLGAGSWHSGVAVLSTTIVRGTSTIAIFTTASPELRSSTRVVGKVWAAGAVQAGPDSSITCRIVLPDPPSSPDIGIKIYFPTTTTTRTYLRLACPLSLTHTEPVPVLGPVLLFLSLVLPSSSPPHNPPVPNLSPSRPSPRPPWRRRIKHLGPPIHRRPIPWPPPPFPPGRLACPANPPVQEPPGEQLGT